MKIGIKRKLFMALFVALLATVVVENYAEARAGGSRSSGSRGSRSYSQPAGPSTSPYRQQSPNQAQQPRPMQQPGGGGFLRSMAGGLVGGMLGGMLFRSLGFGGGMGGMGGGIGLFDILLIGGIIYLIYRFIKKRREESPAYQAPSQGTYAAPGLDQQPNYYQPEPTTAYAASGDDPTAGIAHIRQMDASFSEERFADQAMDIFFKIQGAWMHRDLSPVQPLLTDELRRTFQVDLDELKRQGRINRLENIAVRSVEIVEAWQEQGQDYVTARMYANLLDYTTDEAGKVLEGSTSEPVKFEEYWTFTRPVGPNGWKLSAINQK